MTIYEKLAAARVELQSRGLKKSGKNSFSKYDYFELADFIGAANEICKKLGILPVVSFGLEEARMTIYDAEGEGKIEIASPMGSADLKGCHAVQNIGAVETYQRRYLYMTAFEIAECDALDAGKEKKDEPTDKQVKEFVALGGSVNSLASYLKKDVDELTREDLDKAISLKRKKKEKVETFQQELSDGE